MSGHGRTMASPAPPRIFSPTRRLAMRQRMRRLQQHADAPRYILDDMVEDVLDRLAFLRHEPRSALVIGDISTALEKALSARGCEVTAAAPETGLAEESPLPVTGFDLIVSLGTLDTVNDLPGALIHLRQALAPGGLMIASFPGAGSLASLREIMLAADADRPAPRLHPMVDVRAGGQLLQRAGFADPVIDSRTLRVSFSSLARLVSDLRAQGLANVLADPGPALGKTAWRRAHDAFASRTAEGKLLEQFEILTLSGWKR